MREKADIGLIGLAVMGQNLVLNMESAGYNVVVYNRTPSITEKFIKGRAVGKMVEPAFSMEELVSLLKVPRKIILMVKAGKPVDSVLESLIPYLEEGDIIIDGGNSHYTDTERRYKTLNQHGVRYLGTGISGGEYGALHGPSIMPGGDKEVYSEVEGIFQDIAARTEQDPCTAYLGPRSAGHYVKMVHNGIEYGVMELIAEVYDFMRKSLVLSPAEMGVLFAEWNNYHKSYLLEITAEILHKIDGETTGALIDIILDEAKQKGTGKWSVQEALKLGIPIPTITAAVNARNISRYKEERIKFSEIYKRPVIDKPGNEFIKVLEDALYLGTITAYVEGMSLLQGASTEYGYNLPLAEIARIWGDGCIIRSKFLKIIQQVYNDTPFLSNLLLAPEISSEFSKKSSNLRLVVIKAKEMGIPVPAFSAALDYFDSLNSVELPANMIQAQRDYFGAHTYQRRDKEGIFHTEWQDIHNV